VRVSLELMDQNEESPYEFSSGM